MVCIYAIKKAFSSFVVGGTGVKFRGIYVQAKLECNAPFLPSQRKCGVIVKIPFLL